MQAIFGSAFDIIAGVRNISGAELCDLVSVVAFTSISFMDYKIFSEREICPSVVASGMSLATSVPSQLGLDLSTRVCRVSCGSSFNWGTPPMPCSTSSTPLLTCRGHPEQWSRPTQEPRSSCDTITRIARTR